MRLISITLLLATLSLIPAAAARSFQDRPTGVLLLAHGGSAAWNDNVREIAATVNLAQPTEVALGMATRATIQTGIDRLTARGVGRIVAVPLFVSSHSSVIASTEYLLGLRTEMPADLRLFAKMAHGDASGAHAAHGSAAPAVVDGTTPVTIRVPLTMSSALDAHPIVAAIVGDRAAAISRSPRDEAVILVAHGPESDEVNDRWLANLRRVADAVSAGAAYRRVDALTVRDDASPAVKEAATAALRTLVETRTREGSRVLVVPVLLSYGGIEAGIRKRLEGLDYTMADRALAPDARLAGWVREMAASR